MIVSPTKGFASSFEAQRLMRVLMLIGGEHRIELAEPAVVACTRRGEDRILAVERTFGQVGDSVPAVAVVAADRILAVASETEGCLEDDMMGVVDAEVEGSADRTAWYGVYRVDEDHEGDETVAD